MQRALLVPIQPRPRPAGRPQDLLKSRYATAQPVNIKEFAPQQPLERLAGATCRLAGLLHLAGHLRDGWARPIGADTFAAAIGLADYLVDHARAVFDLMGADPRLDDARWLLDWIARTGQVQFTRRDAHHAAPRGRFPKATDLDPALSLLEEHGWLRRVDTDRSGPKGGRPPSPRFLVNPLHPPTEPTEPTKPHPPTGSVGSVGSVARGDTSGSPR